MLFRAGQKVRCVVVFCAPRWLAAPKLGRVYTVRDCESGCIDSLHVYLRLKEIRNPPNPDSGHEVSFSADGFRALDERPTNIAVFRQIDADAFAGAAHPIEDTKDLDVLVQCAIRNNRTLWTKMVKPRPPSLATSRFYRQPRPSFLARAAESVGSSVLITCVLLIVYMVWIKLFG